MRLKSVKFYNFKDHKYTYRRIHLPKMYGLLNGHKNAYTARTGLKIVCQFSCKCFLCEEKKVHNAKLKLRKKNRTGRLETTSSKN